MKAYELFFSVTYHIIWFNIEAEASIEKTLRMFKIYVITYVANENFIVARNVSKEQTKTKMGFSFCL